MKFPKEFSYYGGCVALANALDVTPHRVRNWKMKGVVPAAWRREVREQLKRLDVVAAPEPVTEPAPEGTLRLSDVVSLIAVYLKGRGL